MALLCSQGPQLWQTNEKCISVNGKISEVIASWGRKRKSNLHTINGHQLISFGLPTTHYSCPQKLRKPGFRQCSSTQNTTKPANSSGQGRFIYLFVYLFTHLAVYLFIYLAGDSNSSSCRKGDLVRDGTTGIQELARALQSGSRAEAISSISTQGSTLLSLTGWQSRDCVKNWEAGDAAKTWQFYLWESKR